MIETKKTYNTQLIGKKVTIPQATNKLLIGITGTIIDETKQTIVIETQHGRKRALKKGAEFDIITEGHTQRLIGEEVVGLPHERIK